MRACVCVYVCVRVLVHECVRACVRVRARVCVCIKAFQTGLGALPAPSHPYSEHFEPQRKDSGLGNDLSLIHI